MKLTLRALMTAGRRRAMSRALVIVGKTIAGGAAGKTENQ
jgi:hypothetical protein